MGIMYLKGEETIKETELGIVVVNYFATWCGPCKMLAPILETLSKEFKVIKIDIDKNKEFAKEKGVQSIPTTFFYKDGELKYKHSGFAPIEVLKQHINSFL